MCCANEITTSNVKADERDRRRGTMEQRISQQQHNRINEHQHTHTFDCLRITCMMMVMMMIFFDVCPFVWPLARLILFFYMFARLVFHCGSSFAISLFSSSISLLLSLFHSHLGLFGSMNPEPIKWAKCLK